MKEKTNAELTNAFVLSLKREKANKIKLLPSNYIELLKLSKEEKETESERLIRENRFLSERNSCLERENKSLKEELKRALK